MGKEGGKRKRSRWEEKEEWMGMEGGKWKSSGWEEKEEWKE
ncbi:hypothetical protein Pcinc_033334, partial [Petrolisthes cinctipes]